MLEHMQECQGERNESAPIINGKASDLLPEELVRQEQAGEVWGLPPERLELLNVRDRTILDRKLADGKVF